MCTRRYEDLRMAVQRWEEATGLQFDNYGGPSISLIKMAQLLAGLRERYGTGYAEHGFRLLAKLADDLNRASETAKKALGECGMPNGTQVADPNPSVGTSRLAS